MIGDNDGRARKYLKLGNSLYLRGRLDEAEECYLWAVAVNPDLPEPNYNLGIIYARHQARFGKAIDEFEQALALNSRFIQARKNLAFCYFCRGDYDSAWKHVKVARLMGAQFRAEFIDALKEESEGGRLRREPKETPASVINPAEGVPGSIAAELPWERIVPPKRISPRPGRKAAIILLIAAAAWGAVHFFSLPRNAADYLRRGEKLARRKRPDGAIAAFRKVLELEPENTAAYLHLGGVYLQQSRLGEAERAGQQALKIDPEDAANHNFMAQVYHQQGRYEEAIVERQQVIELNPEWDSLDWAVLYNNLGFAYIEMKMYDPAIAALKKAIEFWPEDAEAYTNLGFIYGKTGRWEEASEMHQKALEIKPDFREARYNLGWAFYQLRDYGQAWKQAQLAKESGYPAADLIEKLEEIDQEYEQEIIRCQELIAADPDDAGAHNDLAVAFYFTRRYDRALRHARIARELGYRVNPRLLESLGKFNK